MTTSSGSERPKRERVIAAHMDRQTHPHLRARRRVESLEPQGVRRAVSGANVLLNFYRGGGRWGVCGTLKGRWGRQPHRARGSTAYCGIHSSWYRGPPTPAHGRFGAGIKPGSSPAAARTAPLVPPVDIAIIEGRAATKTPLRANYPLPLRLAHLSTTSHIGAAASLVSFGDPCSRRTWNKNALEAVLL